MHVIIDYGMGNLQSVLKACERLHIPITVSANPTVISNAEKLILPGVGHYGKGMENLRKSKLLPILNEKVSKQNTPILGICLGMQLLTQWGEEGETDGLGWIKGKTVKFRIKKEEKKIPHMGWNSLLHVRKTSFIKDVKKDAMFYFAHSYHVVCDNPEDIVAKTNYGYDFPSIIHRENIYGVQFHPEKSHSDGLQVIKSFFDNS